MSMILIFVVYCCLSEIKLIRCDSNRSSTSSTSADSRETFVYVGCSAPADGVKTDQLPRSHRHVSHQQIDRMTADVLTS